MSSTKKKVQKNWMPFFKESDRPHFELQYVHLTHLETSEFFGKCTSTVIRILKPLGLNVGKL